MTTVLEIKNLTKWTLTNGQSWNNWGWTKNAIERIKPGYKEAWETHNTGSGFFGTVVGVAGTIFYHVEGLDEVLGITWHTPWNSRALSNYLAIGFFSDNDWDKYNKNWDKSYDAMRNGNPSNTKKRGNPTWKWCARTYSSSTAACRTSSPNIKAIGTMGSNSYPVVNIKLYPTDPSNRARQ